jgi:hypothetical protein
MKFVDLTGMRFGRWVVLSRAEKHPRKTLWRVRCDCGEERIVEGGSLKCGAIRAGRGWREDQAA